MKKKNIKPYEAENANKKAQVSKMFDNIAPTYDLLNRVLSLGIDQSWRRKMISYLDYKNEERSVLDIATGTGDVAIRIARECPNTKITGLDISANMLKVAEKKIAKYKLTDQIDFIEGDAENLPFEDNRYDGITVAFGVRNFEHLKAGLKELHRVTKDNGTLVVLEFSKPRALIIKGIYNGYFKYILPLLGKIKSGDAHAYDYLYRSVQEFPDGDEFLRILKETGFINAEAKRLTFGICTLYIAKK